ncbi:MAG TPA: T9SS type A sorting domain-containing protein [Chitinophagaceae bacterium]|nr:T9SS type A sorting domain-containing protein [Chitinophagaceae bacterium]
MKRIFTFWALLGISLTGMAQVNESFNDGDFTTGPAWGGNTADWQIVASDVAAGAAGSNTLRLNGVNGGGTSYLSTQVPGTWATAQTWGFFVGRRGQAYTNPNFTLIWLWASEADLTSATVDGYRIRIGDDTGGDELVLQRVDNGVATNILTSSGSIPNGLTDIGFLLRVTRGIAGEWEIFTSPLPATSGNGAIATEIPNSTNANVSQGTVTDNTYSYFNNGYIGFTNTYTSSASARAAQEFDQILFSFTGAAVPVKIDKFDAAKDGAGVKLTWDASDEQGVANYEIQRSDNGIQFSVIGTVTANQSKKYTYVDASNAGSGFYRLRIMDFDGNYKMSHIVSVKSKAVTFIKATPNPVRSILNVEHPKAAAGTTIHISNASGVVVRKVNVPENAVVSPIDFTGLQGGVYHIIYRSKDQQITQTVLKQ